MTGARCAGRGNPQRAWWAFFVQPSAESCCTRSWSPDFRASQSASGGMYSWSALPGEWAPRGRSLRLCPGGQALCAHPPPPPHTQPHQCLGGGLGVVWGGGETRQPKAGTQSRRCGTVTWAVGHCLLARAETPPPRHPPPPPLCNPPPQPPRASHGPEARLHKPHPTETDVCGRQTNGANRTSGALPLSTKRRPPGGPKTGSLGRKRRWPMGRLCPSGPRQRGPSPKRPRGFQVPHTPTTTHGCRPSFRGRPVRWGIPVLRGNHCFVLPPLPQWTAEGEDIK